MNYGKEIDSRWQFLPKIELTVTVEVFGRAVDAVFFPLELLKCLLENPLFHARPMLTRYPGLLSELRTDQHVSRGPEYRIMLICSLLFNGLPRPGTP